MLGWREGSKAEDDVREQDESESDREDGLASGSNCNILTSANPAFNCLTESKKQVFHL